MSQRISDLYLRYNPHAAHPHPESSCSRRTGNREKSAFPQRETQDRRTSMNFDRPKKNKSFGDFLFFYGLVFLSTSIFISFITLKNECLFLRNEIYHLENIRTNHENQAKVLAGNVKNLSRQDRIERVAYDKFKLHIPAPESLIVYIGGAQ